MLAVEMADAGVWVDAAFRGQTVPAAALDKLRLIAGDPNLPPFSFTYDSKPSAEILKDCKVERSMRKLTETRTEYTSIYTHPSGLVVRCVGVTYSDFPTVEWTLYFKNSGSSDSPIIENIRSLDVHLTRPRAGGRSDENEYVLHYTRGTMVLDYNISRGYIIDDRAARHDFEPLKKGLCPAKRMDFAPGDGRPSGIWFPLNVRDAAIFVKHICRIILL
jgi:alpha-galactosidase